MGGFLEYVEREGTLIFGWSLGAVSEHSYLVGHCRGRMYTHTWMVSRPLRGEVH